ncbi:MAG TPA: hypothetical protein VMW23_10555 [Sedimentisphaerales bacterium]|nr:hypothetical protein [Sedimentisphaerales bacterium]
MNSADIEAISARFRKAAMKNCCPECGSIMAEVDRRRENGALFVWYRCGRTGCGGQWLQKAAQESGQLR